MIICFAYVVAYHLNRECVHDLVQSFKRSGIFLGWGHWTTGCLKGFPLELPDLLSREILCTQIFCYSGWITQCGYLVM